MAFAPQQYNNIDQTRGGLNQNTNNSTDNDNNNNNNNRRVQFTAIESGSFTSLLNTNPFEESMPYRPELDEYGNSHPNSPPKPKLSHNINIKSIEINKYSTPSNSSTPDSTLNDPIPCTQTRDRYTSKSILLNATVLVDQCSHQINDDHDQNNSPVPHQHSTTQPYYEHYHVSGYKYSPITQLPPDLDSKQDNINPSIGPLPNANSIALTHSPKTNSNTCNMDEVKTLTFNQSIPAQLTNSKIKLSLQKHFSNDKQAFETWMACCDIQDDTFGYYSALYPLLCEIFAENTQCCRVPTQSDLEDVILKHGAKKMKISKLQQMSHLNHDMSHLSGTITSDILNQINNNNNNNNNKTSCTAPDTPKRNMCKHLATVSGFTGSVSFDFDNPSSKPKYLVTIKYKSFFKFWKWFLECCKIVKELSHLWDANNQSALQCNLFCGREESQVILDQAPQGTFMLRLSSVIRGGIVLSYVEPSFSKKDKHFKHTILIRRKENEYELRSVKKNKNKSKKLTSISSLIRSFVKIKFLYTPLNLYPKKSIF